MPVDISAVGSKIRITGLDDYEYNEDANNVDYSFSNADGSIRLAFNGTSSRIAFGDYTVGAVSPGDIAAAKAALAALFPEANTGTGGSGTPNDDRVSGIDVIWQGGLEFLITPGTYYWSGTLMSYDGGEVENNAGDADNPRIDVIALDGANGVVVIVEGTPAADPAEPTVDAQTYIKLTTVLINALGTEPAEVVNDYVLYDENLEVGGGEWDVSATMTRDLNATNKVLQGTKSIRVTAASTNQYLEFQSGADINIADVDKLIIPINLNNALSGNFAIGLYRGATAISGTINANTRGFLPNSLNTWQYIVIDMASWPSFSSSIFNRVRITRTGSGGTVNFNIDFVRIQKGVGQGAIGSTNGIGRIESDSGSFLAGAPNSQLRIVGANGAGTSILGNTLTITQGTQTILGQVLVQPGNSNPIAPSGTFSFTYCVFDQAAQNFTVTSPSNGADGKQLRLFVRDNGVARNITWGSDFASMVYTLPAITVAGKWMSFLFIYDLVAAKWSLVDYKVEA